jgi:hypothetical protein
MNKTIRSAREMLCARAKVAAFKYPVSSFPEMGKIEKNPFCVR